MTTDERQPPGATGPGRSDPSSAERQRPGAAGPARAPVGYEAWLEIAPRLIDRTELERAEILAGRDLEPGAWNAAELHWGGVLAAEVAAGDLRRAERYAQRCAEEMATRRQAGPRPSRDDEPGHRADEERSARAGIDETAWLGTPVVGPATPFVPSPERTPPVGAIVRPADQRLDLAGQTAEVPTVREPAAPLPFDDATALERYAALWARLADDPDHAAAIAASHGLASEAQLAALHQRWQQRFAQDPSTRDRWAALVERFRSAWPVNRPK